MLENLMSWLFWKGGSSIFLYARLTRSDFMDGTGPRRKWQPDNSDGHMGNVSSIETLGLACTCARGRRVHKWYARQERKGKLESAQLYEQRPKDPKVGDLQEPGVDVSPSRIFGSNFHSLWFSASSLYLSPLC